MHSFWCSEGILLLKKKVTKSIHFYLEIAENRPEFGGIAQKIFDYFCRDSKKS